MWVCRMCRWAGGIEKITHTLFTLPTLFYVPPRVGPTPMEASIPTYHDPGTVAADADARGGFEFEGERVGGGCVPPTPPLVKKFMSV